jgi:hypothetical protein
MKQIHFYALREDILLILEDIERDGLLQYVRTGNQLNPDFETFSYGRDLPRLGTADYATGNNCATFLVTRSTVPVTVESMKGASGVQRYLMDQLINPDTVTFTPAGLWGEDIVLAGRVATVSGSAISQELMKRFNAAFNKHFSKIKGYRVGPRARALFDAGKRLTASVQSPREFDLMPTA